MFFFCYDIALGLGCGLLVGRTWMVIGEVKPRTWERDEVWWWDLGAAYLSIGMGGQPDTWTHLSGFNTKDHRDP